jgi:aspartate aminotransferase
VNSIKPSATMAVNAKANELKSRGVEVINLSVGEPDFDTPDFIKKAAIDAINKGYTKYTATEGIVPLREAIIHKLARDNDLHYTMKEIVVSCGVKQALYNMTQAILNPGDEAIIPAPYWVSYPDMVKLTGATPVIIATDASQKYKITAKQLEASITPNTRIIFLNSPSNPSGMAYTADELKALGAVLAKHPQVFIASDDMYEYILWGMKYVNILNVCPELKDQTVIFNGVAKAHAMTGWRIGFAAGPANIISAMAKIQSQSTTCACSIAQYASVVALNTAKEDFFMPMLEAYKARHDMVLAELLKMPGVTCLPSDGTFYLFPDMTGVIKKLGLKDDIELAQYFIEKANVAMVPGTPFGQPDHIRISVATSEKNLREAMAKIAAVI